MQKNQIGISNVLHDSLDQTRCYWSGIEKNWPYTICDCKKRSGIRPFGDFAALPEAAPIKDGQVTINGSATPN